jgi:pSer/pThr/pTyr-binding forkhead associated (FHA) protein
MVSLYFKDREIDHWVFDKHELRVGRTPDNDITIDNLAVSRLHAVLEEEKGSYYVRDCDSLNGTVVNGRKVGRARLRDGDEISIGKHRILFRLQDGQAVLRDETIQGFDQTMVINTRPGVNAPQTAPPVQEEGQSQPQQPEVASGRGPRLIMRTEYGDKVIEINKDSITIGKDIANDIAIDGAFVARHHAEIVREGNRILIRHVSGFRKVTVGGRSVKETELKNNDEIKIASEEFVYQE